MSANAQRDGRPAEYRPMWRPELNAAKFGSRSLLDCQQERARLGGRKVNFAPGKIPLRGNSRGKCIDSLPAQVSAKHCEKFGWLPLSDVKPRRESR